MFTRSRETFEQRSLKSFTRSRQTFKWARKDGLRAYLTPLSERSKVSRECEEPIK